ncbi:hypothetical protein ACFWJ1_24965, partial [Streptomyces cinereoruber]
MSPYQEAGPRTPPAATRTARAVAGDLLDRTLDGLPDRVPTVWEVGGVGPVGVDAGDERAVQAACGVMHVHGRGPRAPPPGAAHKVTTLKRRPPPQGANRPQRHHPPGPP